MEPHDHFNFEMFNVTNYDGVALQAECYYGLPPYEQRTVYTDSTAIWQTGNHDHNPTQVRRIQAVLQPEFYYGLLPHEQQTVYTDSPPVWQTVNHDNISTQVQGIQDHNPWYLHSYQYNDLNRPISLSREIPREGNKSRNTDTDFIPWYFDVFEYDESNRPILLSEKTLEEDNESRNVYTESISTSASATDNGHDDNKPSVTNKNEQTKTKPKSLQLEKDTKVFKSNYPEALWDLICKYCLAESTSSSSLNVHKCNKSLVQNDSKDDIICNTCFMVVPQEMSLELHKRSRRHLLAILNIKQLSQSQEINGFFYCSICKLDLKTSEDYKEHMFNKKHTDVKGYENIPLYFCTVCDLMMDTISYHVHMSSYTHLLNSMIYNIKLHCMTKKLDTADLYCKYCEIQFFNEKKFKKHIYSLKHCSKKLDKKLLEENFSENYQYVIFYGHDNDRLLCALCNIPTSKKSLNIHFLTDEHMDNENRYKKIQFEKYTVGESVLKRHFRSRYLKCLECTQFKRDCEHVFKNVKDYYAWKEKQRTGNYCLYCNCLNNNLHESSKLHKTMLKNIDYCKICDKVNLYSGHENFTGHKNNLKMYGPNGKNVKLGPYKLFCSICNIKSSSEKGHVQHLAGLRHLKEYNTKCFENTFHCKLCSFSATEQLQYEVHLNSEEHASNINWIKKEFDGKFCFICNLKISNMMSEHIKTDNHVEKLKSFYMNAWE